MSRIKTQAIYVIKVTHYTYDGIKAKVTGDLLQPKILDPHWEGERVRPGGRLLPDITASNYVTILPYPFARGIDRDPLPIIRITYMGDDRPNGESMMQNLEIWDEKTQHWELP